MIPEIFIEKWRKNAPWKTLNMVEQDLIINRALVCLYSNPKIRESLIFRGGTALNKIYLKPSSRYSEDLDFVQKSAEPIGTTVEAIRSALNWLGKPSFAKSERSVKLVYKYTSVNNLKMKLKIEINVVEHFQVMDVEESPFSFDSEWFKGSCVISVNQLEELMATKIRALYQRRKGRDLFDLWIVFSRNLANLEETIKIFRQYCEQEGLIISEKLFRNNLELKRINQDFRGDMEILLPNHIKWDFDEVFEYVQKEIISKV
jgi:hypothetical protein